MSDDRPRNYLEIYAGPTPQQRAAARRWRAYVEPVRAYRRALRRGTDWLGWPTIPEGPDPDVAGGDPVFRIFALTPRGRTEKLVEQLRDLDPARLPL